MLKHIYISNYALISELAIDFSGGFSTITGETGAGKSIIIGALSLILGQRAENRFIKTDAEKCVIEAEFDIVGNEKTAALLAENDLENDGHNCLIRRELTSAGKSRAFVNDTPVALNTLREISLNLIDIHSQHDNLLIADRFYQLEVVDTVAKNADLRNYYAQKFNAWQLLVVELKQLKATAAKNANELEFMQFQYNQLADAKLAEGEQEELENEQNSLEHAEEIKAELEGSLFLFNEENSALSMLRAVISGILRIKNYLPETEKWLERLNSAGIELKDISAEIQAVSEGLEYNPARLEQVQSRLSELYTLQKKFRAASVEELIQIRNDYERKLKIIENFDEELAALEKRVNFALDEVKTAAEELTVSRRSVFPHIEQYIVNQLVSLGIPNIRFEVSLTELPEFLPQGKDEVQFMFSANKNREMQAVQAVASGGEISRLMLAIKALVADKHNLPTIIFDEIDTGVSGEIAGKMGEIMRSMGKAMQVLAITHLPQIAARSERQYCVYKDESGEQTRTLIALLAPEERITEIAKMLSGQQPTAAAIMNAKELLKIDNY
ncbi:MAG: DNA repair protein RecN [Paludibacter sp.]|jgi:DNA repair protein RecN (Recombination protein N)|nr:DNA repair protein RecN [Paludibacter sp.]